MDRYEVMAGKMAPLTDGAHRKWGFTGKVETRSYERLVDALIDFVETGDGLKARFLTGFAACLAADRKSVENRGFGVAVRKVRCHRGEDGTVRVSSVETMHGSVLQRARVMTETTRISAMEIRMSLANTRTPRKRARRRKHSYRRMGTRSMTRKMASAPSSTGL